MGKDINWVPFIQSKISQGRYEAIKKWGLAFGIAGLAGLTIIYACRRKVYLLTKSLSRLVFQYFKDEISALYAFKKNEIRILLIILIFCCSRSVWFAITTPITYDEAWIYNYFTSKSFPESFLLPSNNHKLYTGIAWWFNLFPGNKTFIVRIPSIITGLLTCFIFFSFIKKHFETSIALIGLAWFSSCIPVTQYMVTGKSYIYVLLIHILMLQIYVELLSKRNSNSFKWIILSFIITIGYLANPVFFFGQIFSMLFFSCLSIYRKRYTLFQKIILYNLLSLPLLLPFYLADILSGSFRDLLNFAITQKINISNFFLLCWNNNAQFQTGVNNAGFLFLLIITFASILYFLKNYEHKILLLYSIISIIWLPFYAAIAKDDTSVHKTIYITVSVALITTFIFKHLFFKKVIQKNFYNYLIIVCILSANLFLYKHNKQTNWSVQWDNSAKEVSKILLKNNATSFYLSHYYYKPALEFYYKINHQPAKVYMGVPGSVDYVDKIPNTAAPDFLIIDNVQNPKPNIDVYYKKIFSDAFITLYKVDLPRN
ncbi:MAG: glycosyltransferase family 39 protein [Agriterribacter sp.]